MSYKHIALDPQTYQNIKDIAIKTERTIMGAVKVMLKTYQENTEKSKEGSTNWVTGINNIKNNFTL